ncbi:MAG: hypothetical protein AB7V25_07290 [Mangrovibacterium sp.]
MKPTIKPTILVLSILLVFTSAKPVKENKLTGTWKLVSGEIDGKSAPKVLMDRTMEFKPDQTFEGLINLHKGAQPYNSGMFFLPDDTTMVTLHTNRSGKFAKTAFTYNFEIKSDSLHLYGEYLVPVPGIPVIMRKVYMDEWWVKLP